MLKMLHFSLTYIWEVLDSPGSATPVSSTTTQSTLSPWEATISSMAAIPMSLTEQQRHPFGRDRKEVD